MSNKTKRIKLESRYIENEHWDTLCQDLELPSECGELRVFTDFVIAVERDDTMHDRTKCLAGCPCGDSSYDKELNFN